MDRKSFIIHIDSLDVLDDMTNEQAGQLFKAIKAFHKGGVGELELAIKMAFIPFKNQFIRDNESYKKTAERNKANGLKGGRPENPKKPTKTQKTHSVISKPKKADSDNDSKNGSDSDNDSKKENVYEKYLSLLNSILKKKYRETKSEPKFLKLIDSGYTIEDFEKAITNASKNSFHISNNFNHLTPEFFTRQDKLDNHLNSVPNNPPSSVKKFSVSGKHANGRFEMVKTEAELEEMKKNTYFNIESVIELCN